MSGLPVFGLHGIGSDGRTFDAFAQALQHPDFTALNLPGYAGEPGLPESFETLKTWLHGRVLTKAPAPCVLVGHSIGGMLALDYALDHAEQVAGLVLICTTPAFGGPDPSFKEAFLKARLSGLDAGKSMADCAPEMVAGYLGKRADAQAVALATTMSAEIPEATFRRVLKTLVTFNRRDDLGRVRPPCLIVAGREDANAPPKTMTKMADRVPSARYLELDAGHGLPLECPGDLAEAVRPFLNDLDA